MLLLLTTYGQIPEKPVPQCGVTAAYCYLRAAGIDVPLSAVERSLKTSSQGASILDVRQALESYGCRTVAVSVRPDRIRQLPMPAILYFDVGRWPNSGKQGHYVMIQNVDDLHTALLDWQNPDPYGRVETTTLVNLWDGVAIIPHTNPYPRQILVFVALGIAAWLARPSIVAIMARRFSRRGRISATLLLCGFLGCQKEPAVTVNRISVDTPVKQMGVVSGDGRVETVFRLKVSEGEPVTIVDTVCSCNCTLPDDKVVGVPLAGGSEHDLKVSITGEPMSGGEAIVRTISLVTKPASATPITLAVRYRRLDPPKVSIDQLLVEAPKGVRPEGEFQITRYRRESDKAILLDRNRSESGPFTLTAVETKTERVPTGDEPDELVVIDRTTVQLRATELSDYGDHTSQMKLVFTDGTHKRILTRIRIQHPFSPVLKQISCGQCQSGESWKARVLVKIKPALEIDSMILQSLSGSVTIEKERWLNIEGIAPIAKGPFQGKVLVSFQDKTLPPVELNLHGNVTD